MRISSGSWTLLTWPYIHVCIIEIQKALHPPNRNQHSCDHENEKDWAYLARAAKYTGSPKIAYELDCRNSSSGLKKIKIDKWNCRLTRSAEKI